MTTFTSHVPSPMGPLRVTSSSTHILEISFQEKTEVSQQWQLPQVHKNCIDQLQHYFSGTLEVFDLPLSPSGTAFQQQVWRALMKIPYGTTVSYQQLTALLGDPKAIRAVAAANGKNKIPIIIPCHRVIGSDGTLVGYAAGLRNKEWLLRHEGVLSQLELF